MTYSREECCIICISSSRTNSCDKSDMAKALMVAAQGGHVKVVECLLQKENTLIVENVSNDKELWKQAITEKLSCVFEVLFAGIKVSDQFS